MSRNTDSVQCQVNEQTGDTCNHAVGTATVDYHLDILHADDDGDGASEHSFNEFLFCPYCGESVANEADIVYKRIRDHWEKFWVLYGERHGQEELRRARKY